MGYNPLVICELHNSEETVSVPHIFLTLTIFPVFVIFAIMLLRKEQIRLFIPFQHT